MEIDKYEEFLKVILAETNEQKKIAETPAQARHWSVLYTELEKAFGYYQAFIKGKTVLDP